MKIKYTGNSHAYELSAEDLKKAGVEDFRKTRFPKGQAVEVSDEVGKALTEPNKGSVFEGFPFSVADDSDEPSEADGGQMELKVDESAGITPENPEPATSAGGAGDSPTPRTGGRTR